MRLLRRANPIASRMAADSLAASLRSPTDFADQADLGDVRITVRRQCRLRRILGVSRHYKREWVGECHVR